MKLTTKGRYAVTAMLELARACESGPVSLAFIAAQQGLSQSYLEQLFSRLRKSGLVESVRGVQGGYRLGVEPSFVKIDAILKAVDENIDTTLCQGKANCQDGKTCLTHDLWESLSQHISNFLSSISLQDLLDREPLPTLELIDTSLLRGNAAR